MAAEQLPSAAETLGGLLKSSWAGKEDSAMHIRSHVGVAIIGFVIPVAAASCGRAPEPVEQAGSVKPLQGVWSVSEMTPGSGSATITPSQTDLFTLSEK